MLMLNVNLARNVMNNGSTPDITVIPLLKQGIAYLVTYTLE